MHMWSAWKGYMCYKLGSEGPPVAMLRLLDLPGHGQKQSFITASFRAQALVFVCCWWLVITTTSAMPAAATASSSSSSINNSSSSNNIINSSNSSSKANLPVVPVVTMEAVLPPPYPATQPTILADNKTDDGIAETFGSALIDTSEDLNQIVWSLPCPSGWVNIPVVCLIPKHNIKAKKIVKTKWLQLLSPCFASMPENSWNLPEITAKKTLKTRWTQHLWVVFCLLLTPTFRGQMHSCSANG